MKTQPCYTLDIPQLPNSVVANLSRGDVVTYTNTDSKQTSACGSLQAAPGKELCWIQATTSTGVTGWIPVGRGTFSDAFCTAATSVSSTRSTAPKPVQSLVSVCGECHRLVGFGVDELGLLHVSHTLHLSHPCISHTPASHPLPLSHLPAFHTTNLLFLLPGKDASVECRQVVNTKRLNVFTQPCTSDKSLALAPLAKCQRFDYVTTSKSIDPCGDGSNWAALRYRDVDGKYQFGWAVIGTRASTSFVDVCPSGYCPTKALCRQVFDPVGVGVWAEPCWSASNTLYKQMNQWDTFNYIPGSKQTSRCPSGQDNLCWVKGTVAGITGWIPVGRVPAGQSFVDTQCSTENVIGEAMVREYCGEYRREQSQ